MLSGIRLERLVGKIRIHKTLVIVGSICWGKMLLPQLERLGFPYPINKLSKKKKRKNKPL